MATTIVYLDSNNLLDFSIEYSGFMIAPDVVIFSEWIVPIEVCTSHHSWNGTITTGWLTTTNNAVIGETYTVVNRAWSGIEAVTGFDFGIIGNSIISTFTDLSQFDGKECIRIGGFTNPANNGVFNIDTVTANSITFIAPGFIPETSGQQVCVSAGRVVDKSLYVNILEN